VYGWTTTVTDNGFVAPDAFSTGDIICHRGASPAALSAPVEAGSTIDVTWNTWPESHKGPVSEAEGPSIYRKTKTTTNPPKPLY
jgi:hypothetical protein